MRRKFLVFWKEHLGLRTMADLEGVLERVETALSDLYGQELARHATPRQ